MLLKIDWLEENGKNKICFCVKDSGIGICAETLKVIFEPFVQSKNAQVHPRAGTGLGLTISKQLVERLGGSINVSSEVGVGSEFSFTLELDHLECVETEVLALNFDNPSELDVQIPHFTGRVLVADDLRDIRMLIGQFVQLTGAEVVYATDGADVIRIVNSDSLSDKTFDLILMDIHMPVMDGHQAAQQLRYQGFTRPLVALTAAHMKGDMDRCFESGFTAYLSKPLDQTRLYNCLSRFLSPAKNAPARNEPVVTPQQKSILVVEDDADALAAMEGLLTLIGWQVFSTQYATAALRAIEQHNPDTVLIDLNLPDMNGYDCAAQIHKLNPQLRIIIASGEAVNAQRAADVGVTASLLKPVSLAQLEAILA